MGFANRGSHQRKQRTIIINGKKVTIVVTNKTYSANHAGYNIKIGKKNFHCNRLYWNEAFEHGITKAKELY